MPSPPAPNAPAAPAISSASSVVTFAKTYSCSASTLIDINSDFGDPRVDAKKGIVVVNATASVGDAWRLELRDYYNVTLASLSSGGKDFVVYDAGSR